MARTLEDVQNTIIDRLHAGEPVDRDAVLGENPEHGDALRRFFAFLDAIEHEPAPPAPLPSRLGDFEILREIGHGGMGVVYEAEQLSLRRRVALKVLPPSLGRDARVVDRFRREAEAAAKLRHPNIVPVYAVGEEAGTPFFAMERVEGRSLAAIVRERREGGDAGLPPRGEAYRRWAIDTIAKVADALAYAHGRGILHRDVKPANILVDHDGAPRLTDFGLALDLAASSLTMTGEIFGSPQYMSPEQAVRREAPLDQRTDVYSLAVTLYEVLTLRLPYEATTSLELLGALAGGRVVPPRAIDPTIPEPLERVLLRALERDPARRYASAAAFAADLRAALETRATKPTGAKRFLSGITGRWPKLYGSDLLARRRRIALRIAIISIIGLLVTALAVFIWRSDAARRAQIVAYDALGDAETSKLLGSFVHPTVRMRRVVSRSEPSPCGLDVRLHANEGRFSNAALAASWEASVDGGPFVRIAAPPLDTDEGVVLDGPASSATTYFAKVDLRSLLGDELRRGAARIVFRLTARLRAGRRDGGTFTPAFTKLDVPWTWTTDEKTVFVYDRYPADYPKAVSIPDGARLFAPDSVAYRGASSASDGSRSVLFDLVWRSRGIAGTTPPACGILDLTGVDGPPFATTSIRIDARSTQGTSDGIGSKIGASFRLTLPPTEAEASFLLDLEAGKVKTVRLLFCAQRDAALEQPDVESYWDGHFDVTVPMS
jgi:serine/threonine protein kinase